MRARGWNTGSYCRGLPEIGLLLFSCWSGFAGQPAYGQDLKPPLVLAQQAIVPTTDLFYADLEVLSKRLGVAFVAEGQPFPVTKEGPAPSLSENLSQEDAVREVADYFDYDAVRQGSVYLLTKRYTNPEDLPEVTPEECRLGLKTITQILSPFNPKYPTGTFAGEPRANIVHLLSPDQVESFGKNGLPVSDLTPSQRQEVWRIALNFYLQTAANSVEETCTYIENRNPADPVFHWQVVKSINAFGYDTRSVQLNRILFIPVSDSNKVMVLPDGATLQITTVSKHNNVTLPDLDSTDPTGTSEPVKRWLSDQGKSSHVLSISQALAALNERMGSHGVYKVDPIYAAKPVTLVGVDKLPAEGLMRSFAAVYGLHVAHKEDGSFLLTRPPVIAAKQISDLGRALRSAIPAPISRALRTRDLSEQKRIGDIRKPELFGNYQERAPFFQHSAMRMFRYVAEPQVKSQPGAKVALSYLGDRARNMFELASTVGLFSQVCQLADRPLPLYIADFDHVTLTGGISHTAEGAERLALFFSYRDPKTGEMRAGAGFTNAVVP